MPDTRGELQASLLQVAAVLYKLLLAFLNDVS